VPSARSRLGSVPARSSQKRRDGLGHLTRLAAKPSMLDGMYSDNYFSGLTTIRIPG